MKLLVITNNPDRASFRYRVKAYLEIMRNSGIQCRVMRFPSRQLARWELLGQAGDFDAVFLHKKRLNIIDGYRLRRCARKIIYDFDDAVMYSDRGPDRPTRKRQRSFARTVEKADMVIAGNAYLADHAGVFNENVVVLPTGLNLADYSQSPHGSDEGIIRLVWIGSKSTLGYLIGIRSVLEEIGSRLDNVVLRIICDAFFDLNNMPVEKRPWSEQTQFDDLAAGHIGLAPLPDDKFTRGKCGFKILQYQAAGLPVVASGVGVNAEYVRDGVCGFLAKDNGDWVEKLLRLINDEQLRRQMADAGLKAVQQFDVGVIGRKLCHLITECLKDTARSDND